ncbi:hypothetical protein [Curtobacterium sp. MCBD17_040]|uniref:hypothetical protein n=1 Tax=Curtobacterium sp. MCBD17_040 TaxID=2175674 RepID=UPI000DA910D7|nr:hypothetical protein [Curtobacterium sp. MCBD17_040]WIB65480.1 hypothetical protein DEI94_19090 [Curtobacterium sp. MCBD17_040]
MPSTTYGIRSAAGRKVWYAGTDAKPGSLLTGDLTVTDLLANGSYSVQVTGNTLTVLSEQQMLPAVHDPLCTRKGETPITRIPCGCRDRALARQTTTAHA